MIRIIDYQNVDMNDEEFAYYQNLVSEFGVEEFKGLFKTNEKGIITIITPTKPISWLVIHFAQQVQINQHLRVNDERIDALQRQIDKMRLKN